MRFVQAGVMLLGAVGYLMLFWFVGTENQEQFRLAVFWTIVGWNALLLIVTVLVIVDSIRKVRARKTRELATGVFVVKLAAIPFFLATFAVLEIATIFGLIVIVFGGVLLHFAVAIAVGLAYLAMISTSIYGFASIVQLRREGRIDTVLVVLYAILLLVFVSDTVAGILLFAHSRRRRPAVTA